MANANSGLSLLSRGIGEQVDGVENRKLEVLLEPEDYFNFQKKGYYLPPLHRQPWTSEDVPQRTVKAHKTYTTRKGALLLYAEDLAHSFPSQRKGRRRKKSLEAEDGPSFNTMNDLRSAILSYGAEGQDDKVFMGFPNPKTKFNPTRSVRPGFSAKRYLANWSKSWDDSILNYLRTEGHLLDKNIFSGGPVVPMYRRMNDDISDVPKPYTVNQDMLVTAGQDSATYEFYRIRPDDMEYGSGESSDLSLQPHPPTRAPDSRLVNSGMIATIARDGDQVPHPVVYAQLHPEDQQRVLKKLILQSAAHQSQAGEMPDDMEEAIMNLVTENSKSILSGGTAFTLKDTADEPRTESTLSGNSWPDVIEKPVYEQIASHMSSVPTLPPIEDPSSETGIGQSEGPSVSEKGDIVLPDIHRGSGLVGQLLDKPMTEPGEQSDGDQQHDESGDARVEKDASVKSFISHESKERKLSVSSHLSRSLDNLALSDSEHQQTQEGMKGGVVPKNRTESMRSYKGGKAGSSGSDVTASDADNLSVVGSVISMSEEGREMDLCPTEDGKQDAETGEMQQDIVPVSGITTTPPPTVASVPHGSFVLPENEAIRNGDDADKGTDESTDHTTREEQTGLSPTTLEGEFAAIPAQDNQGPNPAEISPDVTIENHGKDDACDKLEPEDHAKPPAYEDSRTSSQSLHLGNDAGATEEIAPTTSGDVTDRLSSDGDPHAVDFASNGEGKEILFDDKDLENNGDREMDQDRQDSVSGVSSGTGEVSPGNGPSLPTASIGSDLTEEAVLRHSENFFPKPKKRQSASSTTSTPQSVMSVADDEEGSLTASELFNNFSYARKRESEQGSRPSRKSSIQSGLASNKEIEADDERSNQEESGLSREASDGIFDVSDHKEVMQHDLPGEYGMNTSESEGIGEEQLGGMGSTHNSLKDEEIALGNDSRCTSTGALSLMSQLEEEADIIAETVIQSERPRSGRDLTEDAQLAVALWRERLGEIFDSRGSSDETRSLILRHRKNSLDGSSVASLDLDQWNSSELTKKPWPRHQRRVTSADAKVGIPERVISESNEDFGHGSSSSMLLPDVTMCSNGSPSGDMVETAPAPAVSLPADGRHQGTVADDEKDTNHGRKETENTEDTDLQKIMAETGLLTGGALGVTAKGKDNRQSSKSEKSEKSSKKSSIKSANQEPEKVKDFIVGLPHDEKVDYLADTVPNEPETVIKVGTDTGKPKTIVPKPPKKPKKEKLKKGKKVRKVAAKPSVLPKEVKDEHSENILSEEKPNEVATIENSETTQEEGTTEGKSVEAESPEFIIIHEEFSDSEPEIEPQQSAPEEDLPSSSMMDSQDLTQSEIGTEYTEEDSFSQSPDGLSRSQARAAKRAAEGERKRQQIELKRQAKEEARRKAQEEAERKERIKIEYEEEQRRKGEEMRLRLEADKDARRRAEEAEKGRLRQQELAAERERKQQEEYKRKLDALARQKKEEEKQRNELEAQRQREEAERQLVEAERVAKMAEEERIEYERLKREEALIAQIREEEERVRREVEAKLAQDEARRTAIEMAHRQREVERRLRFNRELNSEANVLAHSQEVTRAFTWSYFELLEYLGIPISDNLRDKYLKGQLLPPNHHSADVEGDE